MRVLLVDGAGRDVQRAAAALREAGCDVLQARGAESARDILSKLGDSVDLIVTWSPELAAEFEAAHPGLELLCLPAKNSDSKKTPA
jgi:hypothetical protein